MKGSITVFATMLLMLVSQFLFTVLEAGRNLELKNVAKMNSEAVAESVFAQYCRPLWDEYRILTYDAGSDSAGNVDIQNIKAYMKNVSADNFKTGTDGSISAGTSVLRISMDELDPVKYALITDDNGDVYTRQVVSYMKNNLSYETARKLYSKYSSMKDTVDNSKYDDSSVDNAMDALNAQEKGDNNNTARPSAARGTPGSSAKNKSSSQNNSKGTETENPLVKVQQVRKTGILSQVVNEANVSGNSIDTNECVSHRKLNQGTGGFSYDEDWYSKILLQQYFLTYLSNYTDSGSSHAMNYEVEYIIGGKSNDKDNLKKVVTEILMIRAACNAAYLATDQSKQAEAAALATVIGAITLNPEVIKALKMGILAAWAYCESVLDVRALLAGDKVVMMKSDSTWTTKLLGMTTMLTGKAKAKSCSTGVSYKTYLGMLLFFKSEKAMAYRAMDVQEATVRQTQGYESFRMDNSICEMSIDVTYKYHGLFLCFVNLLEGADNEFSIKNKARYSYCSE